MIIDTDKVFVKIKHTEDSGYASININGYLVNDKENTITIYTNVTTRIYSKDEVEIIYKHK